MSSDRKQGGLLGQRQDRQVKNRQGRSQSLKGRLLTSQKTLNRWEEDVGDHSKTLSWVNGGSLKGGTHRGEDLWISHCSYLQAGIPHPQTPALNIPLQKS